jgi:hypothetical protein
MPIMSSRTASAAAKARSRAATCPGSGRTTSAASSMTWTILVRKISLRRASAAAKSPGLIGAQPAGSTSCPVIE